MLDANAQRANANFCLPFLNNRKVVYIVQRSTGELAAAIPFLLHQTVPNSLRLVW